MMNAEIIKAINMASLNSTPLFELLSCDSFFIKLSFRFMLSHFLKLHMS